MTLTKEQVEANLKAAGVAIVEEKDIETEDADIEDEMDGVTFDGDDMDEDEVEYAQNE